jgi:hypothetical protein
MKRKNYFKYFDPCNQLRPKFSKKILAIADNWELAWEILEPLNIATTQRSEIGLSKRLSTGQKTLYFYWYLDVQIENGGFIQFYFNKTDHYLPSILEGMTVIKDKKMDRLLADAEQLYQVNKKTFDRTKTVTGFSKLYKKIQGFGKLDNRYYKLRDKTISLIVTYIKNHPEEFGKFK